MSVISEKEIEVQELKNHLIGNLIDSDLFETLTSVAPQEDRVYTCEYEEGVAVVEVFGVYIKARTDIELVHELVEKMTDSEFWDIFDESEAFYTEEADEDGLTYSINYEGDIDSDIDKMMTAYYKKALGL